MGVPGWMHQQVTVEQYATWTEEQCAGIEILDGMVLATPSPSKRHNRLARLPANAFWRAEQAATGAPLVYTYVLDPASMRYRDSEIFTGSVKLAVPFVIEVDLGQL